MKVDPKIVAATQAQMAPRVRATPLGAGTFQLHSRPSATKVIYLDFDGHVSTNSLWNLQGSAPITTTAYDTDNNPSNFSAQEQANILEIWQRVAECFSPFDVDVTTEAPSVADLIDTGGTDQRWGVRCLFGDCSPNPAPGAGGVAYLTAFGLDVGTGEDTPAYVLQGVTSNKVNADTAVHEVGHTVGLRHDGLFPNASPNHVEYYFGQGSGKVGWAPHMGAGYSRPLVQFSRGEYANPSNTEDDLSIIVTSNGFGYRPDDFTDTQSAAKSIPGVAGASSFAVNVSGVIEKRTDVDWFKITAGSGALKLDAVGGPANTMLDIEVSVYDSKGTLVVKANPPTDVTASVNQSVTAGVYYVKIEGAGLGDPLTTGYTDYSSVGQYTITGSFSTKGLKGAPVLTQTADLFYGVLEKPKPINPIIKVADQDNPTLPGATVKITNVKASEDALSLVSDPATMGNITSSYDGTKGELTLTSAGATATLAQFQNALRAVSYSNKSLNPTNTPRKIDFQVNDGTINSNTLTSTVTLGYYYVNAVYNSGTKTLTLTDDIGNNSVAISLRAQVIAVEGAGATKIGTQASSKQIVTFPYSGDVKIVGNFTKGADSVSITGLKSSTVTLSLGEGNDSVTLTYCNIPTQLAVDGGPGTDTVKLVGTTAPTKTLTSVP